MVDDTNSFKQEESFLREIAIMIDEKLKVSCDHELGFALIVFKFGDLGISNYISNAGRESMIKALRETADRLELGQDIPKTIGSIQ